MSQLSLLGKSVGLARRIVQISVRRPADLRHLFGTTAAAAEEIADSEADVRPLPAVEIAALTEETDARVTAHVFANVPASISLPEACALGLLLRRLKAKRVFEFGTYKGVSTTQLALNLEPNGEVFTLDLPDEAEPRYELTIDKPLERQIAAERGKGSLIPADLRSAITFLRQDSAQFDPAPYAGTIDLVFVDGAHSAEYVRNDSEKGWLMLRKGGMLVWHDCVPSHRDVVRYVRGCGWDAQRILGTALAFATKRS
jgi:predicted O-methyltransferase YrrM